MMSRASVSKLTVRLLSLLMLTVSQLCHGQSTTDKPRHWAHRLTPEMVTVQYAGNIGNLSFGPGWDYGRHCQWETHLLLGYLPHEVMFNDYFCLTIKQQHIPFRYDIHDDLSLSPLVLMLAANTLFSGEFWYKEPAEKDYNFSSRLRVHIGFGSRIDLHLPSRSSSVVNQPRLSLYYELSTYDLALLSFARSRTVHFADILSLGIGLQYKFF